MQLVVQYEDSEFEVTVEIPPGPAQLGSLVSAWTGHRPRRIHVDGRSVDASIPLAEVGLRTGSVVEIDVPGDPAAPAASRGRPGGVFNRPPRAVQPSSPPSIELPALPGEPVRASRFSWGAMVVPIVLGVVMAVVVHPRMAMFAVFSPAMLAANWLEDHRRHKRERRQTGQGYRRALTDLAAEAKDARDRELAARWSRVWLPQTLRDRAEAVHPRLWERRPHHADFMEIPAGTGCIPWEPPFQGTPTAAIRAELAAFGELHDAPWELRFSPGEVVGIAGRRSPALMAARQLVLQAAVNHGPCDLAISIVTENADDWDWAKWLPHTMGGAGGNRRLAATKDEIAAVASMLPDGRKQVSPHRHLVIVDLPDLVGSDRDLIREKLRDGLELGITGLAVARRTDDLPSLTSTIISVAALAPPAFERG